MCQNPRTECVATMAGRKFWVGGNWKLNCSHELVASLAPLLNDLHSATEQVEVVVAPPAVFTSHVRTQVDNSVQVAGQNCHEKDNGAFTGENSATMLKAVGCEWVILGHSERRHVFGESNERIALKVANALKAGLKVVLCVGEQLEEREAGTTMQIVESQLGPYADYTHEWKNIVIAYEPVWAIGTGKVATPEQAQDVHAKIRTWLEAMINKEVANTTRIVYGGSVKAANCKDIGAKPDVDGFLVGGASLKPEFKDIVLSGVIS